MADEFTVTNFGPALAGRLYPAVTLWNRVEGRPRTTAFDRSLKAEVRDALWMLTRQWQLGEFRGDDAGAPVFAKLQTATSRLAIYRARAHPPEAFEAEVPLEAKAERRPVAFEIGGRTMALDLRLVLGRQWLKMLVDLAAYHQTFLERFPIERPDPTLPVDADQCAHPEVWQTMTAMADRRMDGGKLYLELKRRPADQVLEGMATGADLISLVERAGRFETWVERLIYQPPSAGSDAWVADRLEYQFSCTALTAGGERTFTADEYYQGHLDWYNFDIDPVGPGRGSVIRDSERVAPVVEARTVVPTAVAFAGMPNTRWWTFEEGKTNFGAINVSTTDLGRLLFMEFALVYANDWYLVPLTLPTASVAEVLGLAVTNTFGERFWIKRAGTGADDAWQRWSVFTFNVKGASGEATDNVLLLLPTVSKIQEGPPLEDVALIRDEMANMVWGVEKGVPLVTGMPKPGSEAAAQMRAYLEGLGQATGGTALPIENKADIRYQVMTSVPENWIPFVPVHVAGDSREVQLQRSAMPRVIVGSVERPKIEPRTTLLREGLDRVPKAPYFLHEGEVPSTGVRITQAFQRARWHNGRVFVWLGARKGISRGEASSGLVFDQAAPVERQ